MQKLIVHNTRYEDEIEFEVEDISDSDIEGIKAQLLARGWEFDDCWSEVKSRGGETVKSILAVTCGLLGFAIMGFLAQIATENSILKSELVTVKKQYEMAEIRLESYQNELRVYREEQQRIVNEERTIIDCVLNKRWD